MPLGRIGAEDQLTGAALLLRSPAASYLTGQVLAVGGGRSAVLLIRTLISKPNRLLSGDRLGDRSCCSWHCLAFRAPINSLMGRRMNA